MSSISPDARFSKRSLTCNPVVPASPSMKMRFFFVDAKTMKFPPELLLLLLKAFPPLKTLFVVVLLVVVVLVVVVLVVVVLAEMLLFAQHDNSILMMMMMMVIYYNISQKWFVPQSRRLTSLVPCLSLAVHVI